MLEKVSQLAEQAATNVSRRQFLGRLGRGAMVVAAATGGVLALPAVAHAGRRIRACGTTSSYACQRRNVGDTCDDQGLGKCDYLRGTTECFCSVKGPGPR